MAVSWLTLHDAPDELKIRPSWIGGSLRTLHEFLLILHWLNLEVNLKLEQILCLNFYGLLNCSEVYLPIEKPYLIKLKEIS